MENYTYDVAISFAGEKREYAKQLANKLSNCNLRVFYDKWNPVASWGKDLKSYLTQVYIEKSRYVIILFSKDYMTKCWPKFEFELIKNAKQDYILPITIDGSFPEEWSEDLGYINADDYSIDQIAFMVRSKIYETYTEEICDDDIYSGTHTLAVTTDDGVTEECEVVVAFELTDVGREYVVYTKNVIDNNGNIEIFVARAIPSEVEKEAILSEVVDEDWPRIKAILRELAKNDDDNNAPYIKGVFLDKDGNELLL